MNVLSEDSLLKVEQQREHFNAISQRYFEGRQEKTHILLKDMIWKMACQALPPAPKSPINLLEPMCGFAEGHDIIKKHYTDDLSYIGLDYSDDIVQSLQKNRPELEVHQSDITQFQPQSEQHDLIILIGGLHHVPNHAPEVVMNLAKSLKPGGMFLNFEPTSGNFLFKAVRDKIYSKNEIFDEETERAFGVNELLTMFDKAGLKKHAIFYPGLLAYVMYYNPYAFPWLNVGGTGLMKAVYGLERVFYRNAIGRFFSFATLSIWKKP